MLVAEITQDLNTAWTQHATGSWRINCDACGKSHPKHAADRPQGTQPECVTITPVSDEINELQHNWTEQWGTIDEADLEEKEKTLV